MLVGRWCLLELIVGDLGALTGLFFTALLAATVLPAQSEFLLAGLHLANAHDRYVLVAVATAGNVLGSVVNWVLGRCLIHFREHRWFPIKGRALEPATRFYQRWGVWTLLLAWAPVIGDPLTLVSGIFRTSPWVVVPLVTIGKAARYWGVVIFV
jgi:membrane protein YqaA with SNARE-associated domain